MDQDPTIPPAGDPDSSDEETVRGDRDEDHIAEILEQERQSSATPVPIGNGSVADRYRDLLAARPDNTSEDGSVDGLPRRAGSPVDSLLSAPGGSPSAQVRAARLNRAPRGAVLLADLLP